MKYLYQANDMLKHCDQGNLQKDLFGLMAPEGTSPLWQKGIAARRMLARTQAENSHLDLQAGSRERENSGWHTSFTLKACLPWHASSKKTMFPRPPQTVLPTGGHTFKFWKLWKMLHSNHHSALLEDLEFDSQHPGRVTYNYLLTPGPPDPMPLTSTGSHTRADTDHK